ncbi:tetratricopeptide repeat protein [Xanthobacter sp. AM11]|uniref:tetratricopeptide repeat protein n=1 Tax=Xanthobacter sp. AM11 TaxID=3380643 RepID=UPI0039BF4092
MSKDVRAEFGRATALHREGRFEEAIGIYRRLLRAQPAVFDVQRLLVMALLQAGKPREAFIAARKAREDHPSNAHAHLLLGAALEGDGKWERALSAFEAAAVLDPALKEAHYLAGNMLVRLGRLAESVARFDRVLALDPRGVEALANRSVALSRLGRAQDALRDCERLVELQPWEPRHLLSKGGALLELGRFKDAAATAVAALRLAPNLGDAHFLKGQALAGQADVAGARDAFAAAVTHAPGHAAFQAALARTERQMGNHAAARALCEVVLAGNPGAIPVWQELAEVRREQRDWDGALAAVDRALEAEGASPPALTTKARLLADAGQAAEARALVDAALQADSAFPMALYLRACDDLAEGRWAEGWAGYESRSSFLPPPYRPLPFTRWDGREVPDELIVLGEQGIGDLIQFGRLLRLLADRGIAARFVTKERHVPLLARIDARISVTTDLSGVDVSRPGLRWVPLASLPGLIAPDPADWPRAPYLTADPARIGRWQQLAGEGFAIGICWQGDPSPTVDIGRSAPLEAFAPLAALPGVRLVSLQRGVGTEQLDTCTFAERIVRLGPDWDADGTFLDTAALLHHLDLVVTTDTSLAHLAGARGVRTLVGLRAVPDWRWRRAGETTPLYGTVQLVRQSRAGDWSDVFARMARMVCDMKGEAA